MWLFRLLTIDVFVFKELLDKGNQVQNEDILNQTRQKFSAFNNLHVIRFHARRTVKLQMSRLLRFKKYTFTTLIS